jgi:hypothetical protein
VKGKTENMLGLLLLLLPPPSFPKEEIDEEEEDDELPLNFNGLKEIELEVEAAECIDVEAGDVGGI